MEHPCVSKARGLCLGAEDPFRHQPGLWPIPPQKAWDGWDGWDGYDGYDGWDGWGGGMPVAEGDGEPGGRHEPRPFRARHRRARLACRQGAEARVLVE